MLIDQIEYNFTQALKTGQKEQRTFLGVLKGEIDNEKSRSGDMTDEKIQAIAKKMQKSLQEINTPESKQELIWLEPYLPQLMSKEEIIKNIQKYQKEGVSEMKDFMARFNQDHKGKIDNKLVKDLVSAVFIKIN